MNSTIKRRILLVLPYLALAGLIAIAINFRNQKEEPQVKEEVDTTREVVTVTVNNQPINFSLNIQGELNAFDEVEIFAEAGGLMLESSKPFKKGVYFSSGSTLARMDNEEARLALLSQKASLMTAITQIMPDLKIDYPESFPNWETYLANFNIEDPIQPLPQPVNDQEKFFIASRNINTQYYNIKSAENRLSKYRISAPFNGVLTEALVQTGTVIRVGQKLGTFMRTGTYEMEARIPLSEVDYIKVGDRLSLTSTSLSGTWTGQVKRISDQIDRGSQTVSVFIGVSGQDLKEGMYLRGVMQTSNPVQAIIIPQELLINGEALYTVTNGTLQSVPVEVVRLEGDMAIVTGLEDGTSILERAVPGAYQGMPVVAKPSTTPENPRAVTNPASNL
jgi:membrane fusion protein (multidrug efflux system)